jgi:hypothetical protein
VKSRILGGQVSCPSICVVYAGETDAEKPPIRSVAVSTSKKGESGGTPNPQKSWLHPVGNQFYVEERRVGRDAQPPENRATPDTYRNAERRCMEFRPNANATSAQTHSTT